MSTIQVRIVKDRTINLKINSDIFDRIKKMARQNKRFVGDYINQVLLEHLRNAGIAVEMQIDDSLCTILKKQENEK